MQRRPPEEIALSDTVWDALVAAGRTFHLAAGESVYRPGESPTIAAVITGVVRLYARSTDGRQATSMYARPRDIVGMGAVLLGRDDLGAEAVVDSTVAVLTVHQLKTVLNCQPEAGWAILEYATVLAARAIEAAGRARFEPMTATTARHLLEVAPRPPDGSLVAPVTHQRLAEAAGSTREVITRVLGGFRQSGYIESRRGRLFIRDRERLEQIAAGEG